MNQPDLAQTLLSAWDTGAALDPAAFPVSDPDAGLALQARIAALRRARGERELGYKIGFTNRSIWPLYDVHHPIWGPMWDSTVVQLSGTSATVVPGRWSLPRLEPEIVFGLTQSPQRADPDHVFGCIEWLAHGFEIVCSPWPQWRFSAAQAVAAQGLHGALLVGPRSPRSLITDPAQLSRLQLQLACNDQPVAQGEGSAVLDGPVQALTHLVAELLRRGQRLPAQAIITTGTLTDAQPLAAGQRWQTQLSGVPLPGLTLITVAGADDRTAGAASTRPVPIPPERH